MVGPVKFAAKLKKKAASFACDQSGGTAIEYSLLVAGIFLAVASTVFALGPTVVGLYQGVLDGPVW